MYAFKQSCGHCGNNTFEIFIVTEKPIILSRCNECKNETLIDYQIKLELEFTKKSNGILYTSNDAEKIII
jgi:hypothetical protein